MTEVKSTKCYIEEYRNAQGQLAARLREKATGRKVDLGIATQEGKQAFLKFLSAVGATKASVPDAFTKDGDADCVVVSGDLDFDAPDEIRFIYNENLSYLVG